MNPNMAFYAVNTKILTKKGRILNINDWNKYLESSSVEYLSELFKNNEEIKKTFDDVVISNMNRDSLEEVISRLKTKEIENLLHYFSGEYKEFIRIMLMEEEIRDLSLVIRKLSRGESLDNLRGRFVHSELFSTVNFDDILNSKSVEQLTGKLKKTPYYNGLRNLTKEDALKREFHIEMKLYVVLYKTLFEAAERLDKEDLKAVREIIGFKVDLLNIQWIYRALKYYNISPEVIYNYSLEGGKDIDLNRLKKLCYSKSADEFRNLVKKFLKYDLLQDLNDAEIDINVVINSYMFDYLKGKNYNNIGTAISFIYLLDIVINDLTSIVEGVKYQVPREKLKGYLAYKI